MSTAGRPLYKQVAPLSSAPAEQIEPAGYFLFRKNYVFLGVVFSSAFGFEMAYDIVTDRIWDNINKGRQWKDIRSKYIESGDGDDE